MKIQIKYSKELDKRLLFLIQLLPMSVQKYLFEYIEIHPDISIDEIRLHCNSKMVLISELSNIITDLTITEEHINQTLLSLCRGSVYSYFDTIREGYISVGQGIRAGICGKATVQNGSISGISEINSINIRMPRRVSHAADYVYELLKNDNFKSSLILYSPPGVGKTTILRELIRCISEGDEHIRMSVIDTREELMCGMVENIFSDYFISYPKGTAITLATRSMTPEIIICDEISTPEEADAIIQGVNCGVTFIASTHASSFQELKNKKILFPLLEGNIFNYALGVKRDRGSRKYEYCLDNLPDCK